jgi:tetratricopeptide (TPR) repeat protein
MKFLLFGLLILCIHSSFAQKNKLYSCLAKANKAYEKGDFSKAKNFYIKALSYDSIYVRAYIQLANIAVEEKQFEQGLKFANQAIKIEKKTENDEIQLAYFYSIRSFCNYNLDNTKESMEDISIAIKMNQENASYYFMRSLMRRMLGDIKGCCQDLKKSSELGNMNAVEYLNIYCVK